MICRRLQKPANYEHHHCPQLSHNCPATFSDASQIIRMIRTSTTDSPTTIFFTDEEANAVPHQEADERVHGVEPDREAQDHRGDPRDAQRRDLQSPWQTLATALSSRDSFQKIVNCMFTILAISLALTKAQRITNFCSGGTRPVHRRGRASEVAPHDRVP